MLTLSLAKENELDELRLFRVRIYGTELGIQESTYQDVFNDHLSKNIVLRQADQLVGAIRLAFSRESQEFYWSYLSIESQRRNRCYLRLLLGGVFFLMHVNQISRVRADAADNNLAMYLAAGCRIIGPKFRKYGFTCEWTPLIYQLGTNAKSESRLIQLAFRHLRSDEAHWRFQPRLLICDDIDHYSEQLDKLIAHRLFPAVIPHVASSCEYLSQLKSQSLETPNVMRSIDLPLNGGPSFDSLNRSFSHRNLILVRADSPLRALARSYAVLCGKSLVDLNSWSDFQLDEFPEAQTVFAIADATELPTAASALHKLPEGMTCGIATGSTAEAVSWFLLKNYFRFVAPAEGARVDSSNDNHAHSDRTLTIAFTGKSVCATEWIDTAGSLIDGPASHIVVGPKTCTEEPFLLLSCLCELGYSAGNAVEIVNKVFRDELLSKDGPGLTLLGDPTPRLYPFIWQEVIADLIPNGPSRVVSFTNNGPPMRIYRFSTTEQIPLCTPGLVDKGIFCRVYRHDSEQHLFVFAKNVLPQTLLVPLHQAKDSD